MNASGSRTACGTTLETPLSRPTYRPLLANALVAWTGNVIPTVVDDKSLETVMIESDSPGGFKIRFEGDGVVVSEQ